MVAHNERKYVTSSEGRLVRLGLEFLGEQIEYGSLKRKDVLFDLEFHLFVKTGIRMQVFKSLNQTWHYLVKDTL